MNSDYVKAVDQPTEGFSSLDLQLQNFLDNELCSFNVYALLWSKFRKSKVNPVAMETAFDAVLLQSGTLTCGEKPYLRATLLVNGAERVKSENRKEHVLAWLEEFNQVIQNFCDHERYGRATALHILGLVATAEDYRAVHELLDELVDKFSLETGLRKPTRTERMNALKIESLKTRAEEAEKTSQIAAPLVLSLLAATPPPAGRKTACEN